MIEFKPKSSLIRLLKYDDETKELEVFFHSQQWKHDTKYLYFPETEFFNLIDADSVGRYYLDNIEHFFKTERFINKLKNSKMARKSDKVINLRVDVTKINKDWLFKGEKGTYLDLVLFYREEPDEYKTNGMVTQAVPKKVWENDRNARGNILGNCKDFDTQKQERHAEAMPTSEAGTMVADAPTEEYDSDLPF